MTTVTNHEHWHLNETERTSFLVPHRVRDLILPVPGTSFGPHANKLF